MKNDFRIYYYNSGTLHKHIRFKKSYENLEELEKSIESYKYNKNFQWVITQYFEQYNSKIIKIIDNDNFNK